MQAYARAEIAPPTWGSDAPRSHTALKGAAVGAPVPEGESAGHSAALASLLVESLDDGALEMLAGRLAPHLPAADKALPSRHVAFTVASLSADLDVSQKTIRSAIARGELRAVKRGARWIISAHAVDDWATACEQRRTVRKLGVAAPKAAGPSLRSVLCEGRAR